MARGAAAVPPAEPPGLFGLYSTENPTLGPLGLLQFIAVGTFLCW
jgi:hypothetical protein